MIESLEAMIGLFLSYAVMSFLFTVIFLWIGTKISGSIQGGFKKSVVAALFISIIIYSVSIFFYVVPFFSTLIGFFVALIPSFFIIRFVFSTSLRTTAGFWILSVAAQTTAIIFGTLLFVGAIRDLLRII